LPVNQSDFSDFKERAASVQSSTAFYREARRRAVFSPKISPSDARFARAEN
jgi:hypothetical protein